jgi:Flp pilus assembly protein TadG
VIAGLVLSIPRGVSDTDLKTRIKTKTIEVLSRTIISLWRSSEGTAIVESAVIAPLLFTLVLGVFEFSWYFYNQQLVEAGVRDAARYLARIRLTSTTATPCTQTAAGGTLYMTYAENIAMYGNTAGTGTPRVSGWTGSATITCPTTSGTNYADGTTIYLIDVTTAFTDPGLGFFRYLGFSAPSIKATHKERFIGPG